MKYIKLFIISIFFFTIIFFLISLLFPSSTYISRAMNIAGNQNSIRLSLPRLFIIAFNEVNRQPFVINNYVPNSDTLHFNVEEQISGGMAIYTMGKDSVILQLFYHIKVPWYKPWQKFGLMMNEEKYGPSLDTAINNLNKYYY